MNTSLPFQDFFFFPRNLFPSSFRSDLVRLPSLAIVVVVDDAFSFYALASFTRVDPRFIDRVIGRYHADGYGADDIVVEPIGFLCHPRSPILLHPLLDVALNVFPEPLVVGKYSVRLRRVVRARVKPADRQVPPPLRAEERRPVFLLDADEEHEYEKD